MIVKYEAIKSNIRNHNEEVAHKYRFFRPFYSEIPLLEHLKDMRDTFEKRVHADK